MGRPIAVAEVTTASRARFSVLSSPGTRVGLRTWLARNGLTAALVVLVAATLVLAGGWTYVGLPGSEGKLIDLAEGGLLLWLLVGALRARRWWLLAGSGLYLLLVLSGVVYSHAPSGGITTSVRNWLLVPILGLLLAAGGTTEARSRAFVNVLLVLGAFEFLLTVVQLVAVRDATVNADLITGSLGYYEQNALAIVILLIACVGAAGYLVGAPGGLLSLFTGMLYPLFSAWGVAKLATLALPLLVLVITLVALAAKQTTGRRAVICFAAAVASSGVVIASYAVFYPDAFRTFTSAGNFSRYVNTGSADIGGNLFSGSLTPLNRGPEVNHEVVGAVENATVTGETVPAWGARAFTVSSTTAGNFAAYLQSLSGHVVLVNGQRAYGFSARIADRRGVTFVQPGIVWFSRDRTFLRLDESRTIRLAGGSPGALRDLDVAVRAPSRSAYAFPFLRALGSPSMGASFYIRSIRFGPGSRSLATARLRGHMVTHYHSARRLAWFSIHPDVPGHLKMLRMSATAISGHLSSELFGEGLGSATPEAVAAHGGGPDNILPDNAAAGAHSDIGGLILERGWIGVALVALAALALILVPLRVGRQLPTGRWTTALTLAIPGAVVAMTIYGLISTAGLQTHGPALIFWLIVGLGLAPALRGQWKRDRT